MTQEWKFRSHKASKETGFRMQSHNSYNQTRIDRTIAILGSSVPVAIVMGVVPFEFFFSLVGLVWLVTRIKYPVRSYGHIANNLLFWPITCWFIVVLASRFINGGTVYQIVHDIAFLRYPLFVVAMLDVSSRIPVHRYLLKGVIVGIVYAGLNMLSAHLIGYDFLGKPLLRYVGKLKEGARIGGFCAYAAPMVMLWAVFDGKLDKKKRIWVILLGLVAMLLLASSRVRTAFLAAMIGLLGGFLSQFFIRKQLRMGSLLVLILLAGLGAWGVMWMQPSLESLYDRVYYWHVSWELWLQNPIAGVGISSFKDSYLKVAESGIVPAFVSPTGHVYQELTPHHAHNLILQLLTCNGILGLGVFGWIYLRIIKILRNFDASWQTGLLSWPFICLGIGLTGWNIYDPFYTTIIFYFLAMISVSASTVPYSKVT